MIEKEDVQALIPHRGKMLLLGNIIDYDPDEGSLTAEYHITKDCLFFNSAEGGVPSWAAFECIAQAYSAFSGIRDRTGAALASSGKQKAGYILSVSKMQIFFPVIKPGSTIVIKVKELEIMDSVCNFEGKVFLEDTKILEGKITVMAANEGDING